MTSRNALYYRLYRYEKFGLTRAKLERLLDIQDHRCAVCRTLLAEVEPGASMPWMPLHLDHDHTCCPPGRACAKCLRGILCAGCNRRVGVCESGRIGARTRPYTGAIQRYLADPPAQRLSRRTVTVRAE